MKPGTGSGTMRPTGRLRRLGVRREVVILLPVSLLLVVALSLYTLLEQRNALELLAEERRQEAARAARDAAALLAGTERPGETELRRLVTRALGAALLDGSGAPLARVGDIPTVGLLAPLGGMAPGKAVAHGPGAELPGRVAGFAPLAATTGARTLRVDLPAVVLGNQLAAMDRLLVLVLAFLRHLLAPFDRLLERARQVGGEEEDDEDEMAFLLNTFERALGALAERAEREDPRARAASVGAAGDDDIAALGRTLAPSLESGLLLLDQSGAVLALNPVGAELLDIAPPPPGTPLATALASQAPLAELLATAVGEQRGVRRRECQLGPLTLGLTVHPLRRADREVRGFLVLFADLTETRRQAAEGRLAEGLAQLGEMAAGMAHELRNSLATLSGYLALIDRRGKPRDEDGQLTEYLAEIRRETGHLERVVGDFLSFAQPGTVRSATVDLEALARRAAADPALAGAEVEIAAATGGDYRLAGDPQLLERALRNLLANAVAAERQAGLAGGARVGLGRRDEEIELVVEDRGPGIDEAMRERLFLPFSSSRPDGVGLGLALVHRIVTLHQGRILVEDREGGGTRFRLLFATGTSVSKGNDS